MSTARDSAATRWLHEFPRDRRISAHFVGESISTTIGENDQEIRGKSALNARDPPAAVA